jgi:predicted ArsR family transcriptional regulator
MAIEQGPVISTGQESEPRPETISERKLLNIISAVGNHEAKALLLVLMQDDVIYTPSDMATLLNGAQEKQRGWKRRGSELWRYCDQTFEQIGLVVQKPTLVGGEETVGFIKTQDGKTWGNTVASEMLRLSSRNKDYALVDMVGETSSPSNIDVTAEGDDYRKRPIESRLKIYRKILNCALPTRKADIVQDLDIEPAMGLRHLRKIGEAGLIGYESNDHGKPFVFYKLAQNLPGSEPLQYKKYKTMTNFVFGLLRQSPEVEWTREMVVDSYNQTLGAAKNKSESEYISEVVSRVFNHLERSGFARRGKYSISSRSEVSLDPKQRKVISDIVGTIDAVWHKDEDVARASREYISYLRSSKTEVSNLMIKAREHSTAAGKSPVYETNDALVGLVGVYPNNDAKFFRELLEKEGTKLSRARVSSLLLNLTKAGQLKVSRVRDVNHYSIADPR